MSNIPFNSNKTTELGALNKISLLIAELERLVQVSSSFTFDKNKGAATPNTIRVALENQNSLDLSDIANYLRYSTLDKNPNVSITYTYFTGVTLDNPSGAPNIQSEVYTDTVSSTILLTKTFTWDSANKLISVTNS